MNRVVFKNEDGSVSILIPAQDVLDEVGIIAIAKKDVPAGLPYWITSDADLPQDRTMRDKWGDILKITDGEPHGIGGTSSEFSEDEKRTIL